MGLRDIALALVFFGALPLIPFRPFLGLMMFSWLAYLRPQDLSWILGSTPFSQWVALAMMAGIFIGYVLPSIVPRERLATLKTQTIWMIVIWGWVWICCQTAIDPGYSAKRLDLFTNVIIISVLTTGLVRSRERFRLMILVIGLSLGALGLKYALFGALRGGAVFLTGPGGFMGDINAFALCLNMGLPLLAGIAFVDRNKAVRLLALVLAIGSVLTIVFTFSRGGLLTLAAVAVMLVWTPGRRLVASILVVVSAAGFFLLAGESFKEQYFDRAGSIKNYEEDASAMGRIEEWGTAMRVAQDYPVFGVGPRNWALVYGEYSDRERVRVTHNSFLEFLVDTGYPGLMLLSGLLLFSLYRLQQLRVRYAEEWVQTNARMLQISMIAFVIGGSLLNMAYLDLLYHLIALSVSLEVAAAEVPLAPAPEAKVEAIDDKPWYMTGPAGAGAS